MLTPHQKIEYNIREIERNHEEITNLLRMHSHIVASQLRAYRLAKWQQMNRHKTKDKE